MNAGMFVDSSCCMGPMDDELSIMNTMSMSRFSDCTNTFFSTARGVAAGGASFRELHAHRAGTRAAMAAHRR